MSLRIALADAAQRLGPVSDTPRLDAELLAAYALNCDRTALLLHHLDMPEPFGFADLIARRMAHEPVAYITGEACFRDIVLHVAPGVLIPRPDSETLIEAAIAHFGDVPPRSLLDLGTGPGTLLLAALSHWPGAAGIGVDRCGFALELAAANAQRLGLAGRSLWRCGDWAAGIDARFDLILCNPPYVEEAAMLAPDVRDFEPHEALFAGEDGLDAYRVIMPQLPPLLNPGGLIALEIGWRQARAVSALADAAGFAVAVQQDLAGRDRALLLTVASNPSTA